MRWSVLDTGPIGTGLTATDAVRDIIRLAKAVDCLGCHRYWVAEHHNSRRQVSSAPAVLIGEIAAATQKLRVGSGGVLLSNHLPLIVAEQFGILEALHPGRIDLGVGRGSGTDPVTAAVLRRTDGSSAADFTAELKTLCSYFAEPTEDGQVSAVPAVGNRPAIWVLGSSPSSGARAGRLGLSYAYAHHLDPGKTIEAIGEYRRHFRPSPILDQPQALVAAFVIVGDTDEHASWLAGPLQLGVLQVHQTGRSAPYPTAEEADAYRYSDEERELVAGFFGPQLFGSPATVARLSRELLGASGADELMALTVVPHLADRIRSYELLAAALE